MSLLNSLGLNETDKEAEASDFSSVRRNLLMGGLFAGLFAFKDADAQGHGDLPYDPTLNWVSPELRLARRITFGLTAAEAALAKRLGYNAYLERHLNYTRINDGRCESIARRLFPIAFMNSRDVAQKDYWEIYTHTAGAYLYRSVNSKRQLYHRMVEFWTDHFNIFFEKDGVHWLLPAHYRDAIQQHAMTTFPQLLRAVCGSPGMLEYLDNAPNSGEQPNINFARELLELHTMGVDGGYTRADIYGVARSFTGWSYEWDDNNRKKGRFIFRPDYHDFEEKSVLGNTIPAGRGIEDGQQVIDILVNHPSTARFISKKLIKRFLRPDPTDEMITQVAAVYTSTGGDIKAMLRAILSQENILETPAKYKRPYHLAVSVMRSWTASLSNYPHILEHIYLIGQAPFLWSPPDGYPDKIEFWAGLILPRWDFGLELFSWGIDGISMNLRRLWRRKMLAEEVVQIIEANMFAGEMDPLERAELVAFLDVDPLSEERRRATVALALCSPNYQWY